MADHTQEGKMDTQAMMALYQKLGAPGTSHELLEGMAGTWSTKTKSYLEPGKPPVESTGTCEQQMILDGRFLHQEFKGDMMGAPFIGIGVTGYDNHKKTYVSTWMDSMSTGIYYFEGTVDPEGKTITQEYHGDDPVRGPMTWRSVTKIVDENTHFFEMYGTDKTGEEQLMMEIVYTRKQ